MAPLNGPMRTAETLGWLIVTDSNQHDRPLLGAALIGGRGRPVYQPTETHRLIVGPPGAGKFTCAIAWTLVGMPRASLIVIDPKDGEAALRGAPHRSCLGPTHLLDPFRLCNGYQQAAFNPLLAIRAGSLEAVSRARRLAEALIVPGRSKDPFWENSARNLLKAIILHVAAAPSEKGRRSLKRVRALLSEIMNDAHGGGSGGVIQRMIVEDQFDGLVAETLNFFVSASDRTASDVVATITADLGFLDVPQFEPVLSASTFDFGDLKQRIGSVMITCGAREMHDARAWLRVVLTSAIDALLAARGSVPVHIVIDEFPLLGSMKIIEVATSISRGANVYFHLVCQSLAQLEDVYGRAGFQALMGNCRVKQILGAAEMFTAKEVSDLLGQATIKTKSESHNRGQRGGSQGETESYTGRALLTPAEVMSLPRDEQVILATGLDPVRAWKQHYFEGSATDAFDFEAMLTPEKNPDAPIWVRRQPQSSLMRRGDQ